MKKITSMVTALALAVSSVSVFSFAGATVSAKEVANEMKMPIVVYDHLDDHFLFEFDLANLMGLGLYQDYTAPGVPENAGIGLVESELGENGTPVYKKETVEKAAEIMKNYLERDFNVDNSLHNKIKSKISTPGTETEVSNEGWVYDKDSSWEPSIYGGITCKDDEQTEAYVEMDVIPGESYIVRAITIESNLTVARITDENGNKLADVATDYKDNNKFTVPAGVNKIRLCVAPQGEGGQVAQEGRLVRRFDGIRIKKLAKVNLGDYEKTKTAYSIDKTKTGLDDIESCMDYIYYMTNNFWSDTADVTQKTSLYKTLTLTLDEAGKTYEFDNNHKIIYDLDNKNITQDPDVEVEGQGFYPVDAKRLGDKSDFTAPFGKYDVEHTNPYEDGEPTHNYHFAMKAHCDFYYDKAADLVFDFTGDDDVYLFINGKLALDLGGAHTALSKKVKINDIAADLGLEDGKLYSFDFFYMERHSTASNIRIQTNMVLLPAEASATTSFKDANGNVIPDGEKVYVGEKLNVEYTVKAGVDGMSDITFIDSDLKTKIGKDGFDLGECSIENELRVDVKDKNGNPVKSVAISKDDINDETKVAEFMKAVGELVVDKDGTATLSGFVKTVTSGEVIKSTLDVDITSPQVYYDENGHVIFVPEKVEVNESKSSIIPKEIPKANVTFVIDKDKGITNDLTEKTVDIGKTVGFEPEITVSTGYEFVGWTMTTEETTDEAECDDPAKTVITSDTVFIAQFNPIKYGYTVRYVDEDKEDIIPAKTDGIADYNSTVTEEAVEIQGYDMPEKTTQSIVIDTENNEIIFVYSKKEYSVVFDPKDNGVITDGDANQTVKYKETPTEPGLTADEGYKFIGWYIEKDGEEIFVPDVNSYEITEDTVFFAKYDSVVETIEIETDLIPEPPLGNDDPDEDEIIETTGVDTPEEETTEEIITKEEETTPTGSSGVVTTGIDSNDMSQSSPKTGYINTIIMLLLAMLASLAGGVTSYLKLRKEQ